MPRALFISQNLIGDGMNIYPALKSWYDDHQDWEIDLLTYPDHAAILYKHMNMPIRVILNEAERRIPYDLIHRFDTNVAFQIGDRQKVHIAHAYAIALGVEIKEENALLVFDPPDPGLKESEKGLVIVSPFSRSCSSQSGQPPNKMLPWEKWEPIVAFLRTLGPIGVVGGPTDRAQQLRFTEDEYICGLPLDRVAHILRHSKCVVTIDNGMAHMAASQQCAMVNFYPACLGPHWIVPLGDRKHLQTIRFDPVEVDSVTLTLAVKNKLSEYFKGNL